MPRLLFTKSTNAIWISHLDLMRLFQRAFKRAGLSLVHTQGFNPRPSVSIALPLSVGVESSCELLDFDLEGEIPSFDEIRDRLNCSLVEGVRVSEVYSAERKPKEIAYLSCCVTAEYDEGVPAQCIEKLYALFHSPTLMVEKKTKNGISQQDIIPMIHSLDICQTDAHSVNIHATICCQNPALNPMQFVAAIKHYMPELTPSFAKTARLEIFDTKLEVFR